MGVKCFFLAETARTRLSLRRYKSNSKCARHPHGYHEASSFIGVFPARYSDYEKDGHRYHGAWLPGEFPNDPRWPKFCVCGYEFQPEDTWQVFSNHVYKQSDNGVETTLRDAPPGAMWDAWWFPWKGNDGRSLVVKLPDGSDWAIDSRASNCTLPDDGDHKCWIRHGLPPMITVGKQAGTPGASAEKTCGAGAGSIGTPKWHGFLKNGELTE